MSLKDCFSDGNAPRGYPNKLPNPKRISDLMANAHGHDTFDKLRTTEHVAWGQFVSHDFVFTKTPLGKQGTTNIKLA